MRRQGIYWYATLREDYIHKIPWWLGIVEPIELSYQLTVIPLNLVIAWARWTHRGLFYYWSPTHRWRQNRRAINQAVERGRRAGFNQGMAHEAMHPRFSKHR